MKRLIRTILWLSVAAMGTAVSCVGILNVAMNVGPGRRLINSHPEVVQITYERAWMIWPGRVHLTHADISGQDTRMQFEVTAEQATMDFLPRGFSDRVVTGRRLRGHGVTLHLRSRVRTPPAPDELARLPPIRGLPSPLMDPGPFVPPTVGVDLQDIDVTVVKEVWFDAYRFTGDLDVRGGMYLKAERALRVDPVSLRVHGGALAMGTERVLESVEGTIAGSLDEIDPSQAGLDALRRVSARVDLRARVANVRFVNYYLTRAPQVRLDGGAGDLRARVDVDHGMLAPGALVEVASERIVLVLPYFDAVGSGHVRFDVAAGQPEHTDVAVTLASVVIVQRSDHKAYLRGKSIRVTGHTQDLDLTHPPELQLRVELPEASGADLTFINSFVPKAIPMKITSGAGTLAGYFHIDTARHHIDGLADIRGRDLGVRNNSARLHGAAAIHGVLKSLDWQTLRTDLSGSYVSLDDVTIAVDGRETKGWSARVDLPACTVHPKGRTRMDGRLDVRLKNLKPVMRVVAANVKLPWIVKALANRDDVRAAARLVATATTLDITGIDVTTGWLRGVGQLRFSDLQGTPPGPDGILLVTWGALAVGLELHGPKVRVVIVTPTRWYQQRKASLGPTR